MIFWQDDCTDDKELTGVEVQGGFYKNGKIPRQYTHGARNTEALNKQSFKSDPDQRAHP